MKTLKKSMSCLLAVVTMLSTLSLGTNTYAAPEVNNGSIVLADQSQTAPICIDTNSEDYDGISLIADAAANDIELVTDNKPQVYRISEAGQIPDAPFVIIAGTLNDQLIKDQNLTWEIELSNNDSMSDNWERYQIQVVEDSDQIRIVVAGSDKRGTIYGLFHITQDLCGVSPWVYWADVKTVHKDILSFTKDELETVSNTPSVKYRGIFLNDEAPSLSSFVTNQFGQYNYLFYANVYELILRQKGNYLWPAMWGNSFSDDGILNINRAKDNRNLDKLPEGERDTLANARLADDYGVVMGLSHHEPMCRAGVEWQRVQAGVPKYNKDTVDGVAKNTWNYFLNSENIYDFWVDGFNRNKDFDNVITIGMRGESDSELKNPDGSSFTLAQNIQLLKNAITDQKEILKNAGHENDQQTIVLYKEVEKYWYGDAQNPGLDQMEEMKDDIAVLCEDNNGYLRTLPNENERDRRWGVYYHFDYNGGPKTYMWINVTPLQRIWDNMTMAYDYKVDDLWMVNVGDLKPMELPISYFLDMAYDFDTYGTSNPNSHMEYTQKWVQQQFGTMNLTQEQVEGVAQLLTGYTDMNGRRRPEHIFADTFNSVNYNEVQIELAKAITLGNAADKYLRLFKGTECEDAFYQLVYYPAAATAAVNKAWLFQGLNLLYAKRGSVLANAFANLVESTLQYDKELQRYYNDEMSSGYWNGMMSQEHYGYVSWNWESGVSPIPNNVMPKTGSELIVDVQGTEQGFKTGVAALPDFESSEQQKYAITLSNGGSGILEYRIAKSDDWIQVTTGGGVLYTVKTLGVSVDWSQVDTDKTGTITITNGNRTVTVNVNAKVINTLYDEMTFLPSNGVIAINANHFADKQAASDGTEWMEIENYGKSRSTMKMAPATVSFDNVEDGPYLDYKVYVPEAGTYTLTTYVGQSSNRYYSDVYLRYGVQIDGIGSISIQDSLPGGYVAGDGTSWSNSVLNAGRTKTSTHSLTAGTHTIRFYGMDAGLQLQKLVLSKNPLQVSFYGPQETYYVGKTVYQQPIVNYEVPDGMFIPSSINAVDCINEDALKTEGTLNAGAGMVYTYPISVVADGNYLFTVTGSSSSEAAVTLKIGNTTVAEVVLPDNAAAVPALDGIDLKHGSYDMTLIVSADADITVIKSEVLDNTPGLLFTSVASSGDGNLAADHKNSTAWQPDIADTTPTLTFDFGEITYADHLIMSGSFSGVTSYKIETSEDGDTWKEVYTSSTAPISDAKVYIHGTEANKGSQWRFTFAGNDFSLSEIKLNTYYNWLLEDQNIQITVSESAQNGSNPYAMVDGDRIGSNTDGAWIIPGAAGKSVAATFTFTQAHEISGVSVAGIQESVVNGEPGVIPNDTMTSKKVSPLYTISYQDPANTWHEMEVLDNPYPDGKVLGIIEFRSPVVAKAVRLEISASHEVGLVEFEAIEARRYTIDGIKRGYKNWALLSNGGVASTNFTDTSSTTNANAVNDGDRSGGRNNNDGRIRTSTFPAWVVITLPKEIDVTRVDVFNLQPGESLVDGAFPPVDENTTSSLALKAIQIQYWNGSDWVTVATGRSNNTLVWQQFELESMVRTRLIRVYLPDGASAAPANTARIAEVEVWGIPTLETDPNPDTLVNFGFSGNGSTVAASPGIEGDASAIIDGVRTNPPRIRWSQANQPAWVEITLNGEKLIHNIDVFSQMREGYTGEPMRESTTNLGLKNIEVSYFNGTEWVKFATGDINNQYVWQHFELSTPVITDKIRIDFPSGCAMDGWVRLIEVEVWGTEAEEIEPISVTLNKSTITLTAGEEETLVATIEPETAANKNVTWSSDNSSAATVDATGKVTAVGAGVAAITVTTADGNKKAICIVTVNEEAGEVDLTGLISKLKEAKNLSNSISYTAESRNVLKAVIQIIEAKIDSYKTQEDVEADIAALAGAIASLAYQTSSTKASGNGNTVKEDDITKLSSYPSSVGNPSGWRQNPSGWQLETGNNVYAKNEWKSVDNAWYFFSAKGYMKTGWILLNNQWYYLNDRGAMVTGWLLYNNKWYFLNSNGAMATGWLLTNGIWYYLNTSGDMTTESVLYQGKEYQFNQSGACINP